MTVNGPVPASNLGITLEHEHILVDFIGADQYDPGRWDNEKVIFKMLPYLLELKEKGCNAMVETTPAFLGRDPQLLAVLSNKSGVSIITNTGFYGAADNKYLPPIAYTGTAQQLAEIWTGEFTNGIDGTSIKPGFMKISVNPGPLSDLHQKLVRAACITHLETGLTIASHTGPAIAAFEELDILGEMGVHPSAFVWIHAQEEKDQANFIKAAQMGAWISLDGVKQKDLENYVAILTLLRDNGNLDKALISHDAGYYDPSAPDGGEIRSYTDIFDFLLPALMENGFTQGDLDQLLIANPTQAFAIRIRKL